MTWTRVCRLDDLPPDTPRGVTVDGAPICMARTCGAVFAVRDECTHADVPLSEGEIDNCAVECWMYGSRFDLRSGAVLNPPASTPVKTFPVRVHDDWVYVSLM
jgi:3-phenylpropionate/trans-cinnamate dioxygenase ferredoxin subunit